MQDTTRVRYKTTDADVKRQEWRRTYQKQFALSPLDPIWGLDRESLRKMPPDEARALLLEKLNVNDEAFEMYKDCAKERLAKWQVEGSEVLFRSFASNSASFYSFFPWVVYKLLYLLEESSALLTTVELQTQRISLLESKLLHEDALVEKLINAVRLDFTPQLSELYQAEVNTVLQMASEKALSSLKEMVKIEVQSAFPPRTAETTTPKEEKSSENTQVTENHKAAGGIESTCTEDLPPEKLPFKGTPNDPAFIRNQNSYKDASSSRLSYPRPYYNNNSRHNMELRFDLLASFTANPPVFSLEKKQVTAFHTKPASPFPDEWAIALAVKVKASGLDITRALIDHKKCNLCGRKGHLRVICGFLHAAMEASTWTTAICDTSSVKSRPDMEEDISRDDPNSLGST